MSDAAQANEEPTYLARQYLKKFTTKQMHWTQSSGASLRPVATCGATIDNNIRCARLDESRAKYSRKAGASDITTSVASSLDSVIYQKIFNEPSSIAYIVQIHGNGTGYQIIWRGTASERQRGRSSMTTKDIEMTLNEPY